MLQSRMQNPNMPHVIDICTSHLSSISQFLHFFKKFICTIIFLSSLHQVHYTNCLLWDVHTTTFIFNTTKKKNIFSILYNQFNIHTTHPTHTIMFSVQDCCHFPQQHQIPTVCLKLCDMYFCNRDFSIEFLKTDLYSYSFSSPHPYCSTN